MTPRALLAEIADAGGQIEACGDRLRLSAPQPLSADLVARVREAKPAPLAEIAAWQSRGAAELMRAAIVEHDGAIPRVGVPEISDEPALLRDGRRLWRFRADTIPAGAPADAAALIDQARWYGTALIADGCELIAAERWLSMLPPEILRALRDQAGNIIAALRQPRAEPRAGVELAP